MRPSGREERTLLLRPTTRSRLREAAETELKGILVDFIINLILQFYLITSSYHRLEEGSARRRRGSWKNIYYLIIKIINYIYPSGRSLQIRRSSHEAVRGLRI